MTISIGSKVGMLTATKKLKKNGRAHWLCLCECGSQRVVCAGYLSKVTTISCGCSAYKSVVEDLSGKTFGMLTVGKQTTAHGRVAWHCKCRCGGVAVVTSKNLKSGNTSGCGCTKGKSNIKHGMTNSPEYNTWQMMKARCNNKDSLSYAEYGGVGIGVCKRWMDSFSNFISDMGKKPFDGASIDRIDNERGYEPSNCRWASSTLQCVNRRIAKNNHSGVVGVHWDKLKGKWVASISVHRKQIVLGSFASKSLAIKVRLNAEKIYHKDLV